MPRPHQPCGASLSAWQCGSVRVVIHAISCGLFPAFLFLPSCNRCGIKKIFFNPRFRGEVWLKLSLHFSFFARGVTILHKTPSGSKPGASCASCLRIRHVGIVVAATRRVSWEKRRFRCDRQETKKQIIQEQERNKWRTKNKFRFVSKMFVVSGSGPSSTREEVTDMPCGWLEMAMTESGRRSSSLCCLRGPGTILVVPVMPGPVAIFRTTFCFFLTLFSGLQPLLSSDNSLLEIASLLHRLCFGVSSLMSARVSTASSSLRII
jgi:hypothetical protein